MKRPVDTSELRQIPPRVRAVELPLESVPNFSEGRDRGTLEAIEAALAAHADVLDIHADADHNRSVFTLVGSERELGDALLAGIACAKERIDLRRHEGAHPRIGATDVVPIVPLRPEQMERARRCALEMSERIAAELDLPVFLYGESAPGRGPAFFRVGGPEELQRRLDARGLAPDPRPSRLHPRAGGADGGAGPPPAALHAEPRPAPPGGPPGVARGAAPG